MLRTGVRRWRWRSNRTLNWGCRSSCCSILLQSSTWISRFCSRGRRAGVIWPRKHGDGVCCYEGIIYWKIAVGDGHCRWCELKTVLSLRAGCIRLEPELAWWGKQSPAGQESYWVVSFFHDWHSKFWLGKYHVFHGVFCFESFFRIEHHARNSCQERSCRIFNLVFLYLWLKNVNYASVVLKSMNYYL